jgi:long-chain acyl-CoA synthetase
MFEQTVTELGDRPLLYSFTTSIGAQELASLVDGLAAGLQSLGVRRGDRIALYLQNDPQYVIAMLAAWRLGAIALACNPMLRDRELAHHLDDARATTLVVLDDLYEIAQWALEQAPSVRVVLRTSRDDLRSADVSARGGPAGTHDLLALARQNAGAAYHRATPAPDDVAVLTYTSGTTGPAKGAMNTHANIAYASRIYRDWMGVAPDDTILGIAPLYHVTGLSGHIGLALAAGAPLILAHRFDPALVAELVEHHRATVTVAAITAYVALANNDRARQRDFSSMRRAYSGGAPIPPAVVEDLRVRLGLTIRPVYGLTETTGPTHMGPPDADPPVHAQTGALSVGRAVPGTEARILKESGGTAGPGEVGEVLVRGPQVVPGYWQRPEETAAALPDGELHTGDVGVIDEEGWLYLVDRSKDMIIASGFKVWPREVEDVLYEHQAVREAAVVGMPDAYRGETVWAFVSLKAGCSAEPSELIDHCRARLAAYKYPRTVRILEELPKTASGKILRRELRETGIAQ